MGGCPTARKKKPRLVAGLIALHANALVMSIGPVRKVMKRSKQCSDATAKESDNTCRIPVDWVKLSYMSFHA